MSATVFLFPSNHQAPWHKEVIFDFQKELVAYYKSDMRLSLRK